MRNKITPLKKILSYSVYYSVRHSVCNSVRHSVGELNEE